MLKTDSIQADGVVLAVPPAGDQEISSPLRGDFHCSADGDYPMP